MPTRILLDPTPATHTSRLSSSSPRSNKPSHHTHGFLASRWVVEEEKQEEKADNNPSPMHGRGDEEGSLTINREQQQQQPSGGGRQHPKHPIDDNGTAKRPRVRRGLKQQQSSSSSISDILDNNEPSGPTTLTPNTRNSRRATSMSGGFRSSILRELSVRQDYNDAAPTGGVSTARQRHDNDDDNDNGDHGHGLKLGSGQDHRKALAPLPETTIRLSSDDIRASPRFLGYLFCMIASAVLLVSAIQFRRRDTTSADTEADAVLVDIDGQKFFMTSNGYLVHKWKLLGAIYVGAVGVISSFLILLAHFDTFCLPRTWMHVFRDGSRGERNLILVLLLFWAGGLHVCTSSLSVGEVQANVYFTTWIAFGSIALNYGVWREAAGLPSLADKVNLHHRETTYNWMWISIFSFIFAGAATDMYFNRTDIELRFRGNVLYLRDSGWVLVLAVVWTEVGICLLAIFLNEWVGDKLSCSVKRQNGRCVFGWRQMEGFVMLLGVSAKVWVILEYTGVDGVINGLSNSYFGIWGSFFNSVFALGTWLRENKNIEYFVKEPRDRESGVGDKK